MIKAIEKYVKENMQNVPAHGYDHVDRVRKWALKIAKKEGFNNLEIVEAAALLHDIGKGRTEKERQHGEAGAEIVTKYLKENKLFESEEISDICNAIRYHCTNREGEGELLDILRDADMLDLFGAIGILRTTTPKYSISYFPNDNVKGETWQMRATDFDKRFDNDIGTGKYIVDEINFAISCYDNLTTMTAKKIAKPFVDFMIGFIKQMEEETNQNNS